MEYRLEVTACESVHEGFYNLSVFHLKHDLFRGGTSEEIRRELFHRGRCVAVLPFDPVRQEVLLVEQFRIGALGHQDPPWLVEIIAGGADIHEDSEDVARREGIEEAGIEFERLHCLGEFFTSPGGTSERVTLFVGTVQGPLEAGCFGLAHEQEDIRTRVVSLDQAERMLESGVINSLIPAYALQWLLFRGVRQLG